MNPYHKWLGVTDGSPTPDYFTLLGVSRDETDATVIRDAARCQARKLKQYKDGKHAEACSTILRRIKKAHHVLTDHDLRQEYVRRLSRKQKNVNAGQAGSTRKSVAKRRPSALGSEQGSEQGADVPHASKPPRANNAFRRADETPKKSRPNKKPILIAGLAIGGALMSLLAGGVIYVWMNGASVPERSANVIPNNQPNGILATEVREDESSRTSEVALAPETPAPLNRVPTFDAAPLLPVATANGSPEESAVVPSTELKARQSVQRDAVDTSHANRQRTPFEALTRNISKPDFKEEAEMNPEPVSENDQLVAQTHSVLNQHCVRCHGQQESDEGGFDFVSNRDKLIAAGYVLPGNAKESPLLERMVSHESPMPPAGEEPRLSDADVALVRKWIQSGALPFGPVDRQPFVSMHELFEHVAADLTQIKKKDRPYIRYFSISHLGNAGHSPEELQIYKTALAKLLNSLSWNRSLAALKSIGGCQTVFRIDLRDLKWTARIWGLILAHYPYGVEFDSPESRQVHTDTGCKVPVIRADWFVAAASRPPLYHDLLQLPTTDQALEALLQVDVAANIKQERVVRAAFTRSGISQHNRMIERHESIFGAYWKSYDFGGSTGRKNLFENPLGPGEDSDFFDHDGGEIIFRLPNGMLGYMLVDAVGRRIDKGPTEIVSDLRQADRAVVNGVSCMSCHYGGLIQKSDEIRRHVQANKTAYRRFDDIMALYPDSAKTNKLVEADTRDFLAKLASPAIGIDEPTRSGEPIVLVSNRYTNEVDIDLAAAELGIQTETFREHLDKLANRELARTIGALKVGGGVVKRETFSNVFLSVVKEFKLGKIASNSTRRSTGRRPANRRTADVRPGLPFGNRPAAAESSFADGVSAFEKKEWEVALAKFEDAIQLAPDANFRVRVYERLIPLYEQNKSVEKLVGAHQAILNVASDPASIKKAHDRFFNSIIRLVDQIKHNSGWRRWSSRDESEVRWRDAEIPASVANMIVTTFQSQLHREPDHEPTLNILQTFYHRVRNDVHKRKEMLVKLRTIYQARKQSMDVGLTLDLAEIYTTTGQPEEGAEIYFAYNRLNNRGRSSIFMLHEARAWVAAGKNNQALAALENGEKVVRGNMTSSSASRELTSIADVYTQMGEADKGIELYKQALRLAKSGHDTRRLQEKLASALQLAGREGDHHPPEVENLLDPKREYRQEAQKYERDALSNPSRSVESLLKASRSWLQAEDSERALAAAKKAERALRRTKAATREPNHAALGRLYFELEKTEQSYEHYLAALKMATSATGIEKYQLEVSAILEEDSSIQPNDAVRKMLDKGFKYRSQARRKESQEAYDPAGLARNLVDACELWAQADDMQEVERCGKRAESMISRAATHKDSGRAAIEILHKNLANAYSNAGLFELAVKQLVQAMGATTFDRSAIYHFKQIKTLCDQHGVPVPELDADVAKKLDPLNRFRVEAAKYEDDAKEARSSGIAARELIEATESWLKAKETEQASRTASEAGKLLLKSDRTSSFSGLCEDLAELFEQANNRQQAARFYKYALVSNEYEYRKKSIQKSIDRLSATDQ